MVKLKLVVHNKAPAKYLSNRRFETDYAGAWRGHCKTRESAIIAAMKHVVNDGYVKATITDKHTGQIVARIALATRTQAVVTLVKPFKKIGK